MWHWWRESRCQCGPLKDTACYQPPSTHMAVDHCPLDATDSLSTKKSIHQIHITSERRMSWGTMPMPHRTTVRHPQPFPCLLMLSLHQGGSLSGPALMNPCCCFQSPPSPPCALAECLGDSVPWSSQRQRGGWLTSKSQCLPF